MEIEFVRSRFIKHFDGKTGKIYHSPGRINLIGEHTDYNGEAFLQVSEFSNNCVMPSSRILLRVIPSINMRKSCRCLKASKILCKRCWEKMRMITVFTKVVAATVTKNRSLLSGTAILLNC